MAPIPKLGSLADRLPREQVTAAGLLRFLLVASASVAVLAFTWKFGIEEWFDPFLPGNHEEEHPAERWEFVVMSTLFSAAAMAVPSIIAFRLIRDRLQADRLAAAVFNAAPQPMVVTDRQRNIRAVNPAFEELTGFAAETVIGQPAGVLKSELHDASFYGAIGDALETRGAWSGEAWNRRADGSRYAVWLSITSVRDERGRPAEFVGVMTDITWRKEREDEALRQANHDPLTGLANRRQFTDRLQQVMAAAQVGGDTLAILFIDLDGFKTVNDTHGHAVGDLLLQEAAARFASCARSGDLLARFAGDEFVLLLREVADAGAALAVARRCLERLAEPWCHGDAPLRVGASIGIALYPEHGASAAALLECADQAMYEVKRRGRNNIAVYSPVRARGTA